MSVDVVLSRIAAMSAGTLWALAVLIIIILVGAYVLSTRRRDGEGLRMKLLGLFEIEFKPRPETKAIDPPPEALPLD